MKCRQLLLFSLLFISISAAQAQDGIGYYFDNTNHLNVFDHGVSHEIASLSVSDPLFGCDYMAYTDEKNSFMLYYASDKLTLEERPPSFAVATDYSLVYKTQKRLMICEKGEKKLLSKFAGDVFADDSIVVWKSEFDGSIMAYSDGEVVTVEPSVSAQVIRDGKTGVNLFAYNDLNYDFKIYYKGEVNATGGTRITSYACGKDIVAFQDNFRNNFSVFYKGETKVISEKIVKDFVVCNELVAFIDENDNFFIYYQGRLVKIDSYAPEYFFGKDNILCYSYQSQLKIVYQGKITVENNIDRPNILLGSNSVLYTTSIGKARYFYKGKIISNFYVQQPFTKELRNDLPVFTYGDNTIAFLYNEIIAEYGARPGTQ
ncbi:MAG: hypothetical protein JWO44_2 [Bacteroidetes bacterium]|nr:hypothetical protein [Bacteroidota bacterium]